MVGIIERGVAVAKGMKRSNIARKQAKTILPRVKRLTEKVDQFIPSSAKKVVKKGAKGLKQKVGGFLHKVLKSFTDYVETVGKTYNMR